ncbi:DoxX family membrane protein [Bacillus mangrovi]|uniref:DoxX family membrane protein n=1 Tax=Metabacillus mangrovi TaxID=1491830 RepID=A0A7X2S7C8_9BACI|nr:DoxX family protein [Metabacillus mangrovi]MTH54999.1 DoxX family membrane protein [Metabacillus mangrovi]
MGTAAFIIQILLGLAFLFFGFLKFGKQMDAEFTRYGYPRWFRFFTGAVELVSGAFLLAGFWNEGLAAWGSLLAVLTMLGAIVTHLKVKDAGGKFTTPVVLLLLSAFLFYLNLGNF